MGSLPVDDIKNLPKPADLQATAMVARSGIIGQCLQEALDDIVSEDVVKEFEELDNSNVVDDGGVEDSAKNHSNKSNSESKETRLSQEVADHAMKEFGETVARTLSQRQLNDNNDDAVQDDDDDGPNPPPAMIKARVEHYNKINDKWQFVVKDVEFKDRKPLDKNRVKRGRPNLWAVAGESCKRRKKMDLQILVYDDP